MNLFEKATVVHFHRHRIDAHSLDTHGALGWRAQESQTRRFEMFAQVGDLNGCSLLDVGCGHGDLKGFLDRRFSGFTYLGIDQMSEFIAVAKERYGDRADTFFYRTDFTLVDLPRVDYVMASGALSYRCQSSTFYFDMILKMYAAAAKALAFNMLDVDKFPGHPLLVGHDPAEILSFCRELSPKVEFHVDHLDDYFTFFVYKLDGLNPPYTSLLTP